MIELGLISQFFFCGGDKLFRIADYEIQSIHDEIDYVIPQSIKLTNVQSLWDKGYYGKGIHIAILDTRH